MGTLRRRLAYAALAITALPVVAAAQQGYPPAPSPQNNPYPQSQPPYPQGGPPPYPQQGQNQPYPQDGPPPYPQQGQNQPYPQQGRNQPYSQQGQNQPYPQQGQNQPYPQQGQNQPYPQQGQNQPYPQAAPAAPAVTSVCGRLEAQLAAIDRGAGNDPARIERTRRIEDTLNRQQGDLDRVQAQWQRLGCQPLTLFSMFSNQSPQCGPLGNRISQIRAAIDQTTNDLERSRHSVDDDMQRQSVLGALAQNNCGQQYRNAGQQRPKGFLETLFGGGDNPDGPLLPGLFDPQTVPTGGYRTLCVRTCDGYYFPVSFSTSQARFPEDEQTCQKMCPAAEAVLYTHRNPGEDVAQAVSSTGRVYKDLPNAFRYRRELVSACSCKQPGQTWAEALGATRDDVLEPGDVIVTEERAKAMSQPRGGDNPGRARKPASTAPADAPPDASAAPQTGSPQPAKRPVRSVGPTLLPPQ